MAIYEIDTIKQSLKKYAVTLVLGIGAGLYLSNCSNCTFKSSSAEHTDLRTIPSENQTYRARELTQEERRTQVFETYTKQSSNKPE